MLIKIKGHNPDKADYAPIVGDNCLFTIRQQQLPPHGKLQDPRH